MAVREWEGEVDPARVRFMHAKIRPVFSDSRRVEDTLNALLNGSLRVADIPMLAVVVVPGRAKKRGEDASEYYSLNNRRLWVFKELRARGFLTTVRVRFREAPKSARLAKRFDPARCSLTATFMREGGKATERVEGHDSVEGDEADA